VNQTTPFERTEPDGKIHSQLLDVFLKPTRLSVLGIDKWLFQLDNEANLYRMGNGCPSEIHLKTVRMFGGPGVHEFISRETFLRLGIFCAKFR